MQGDEERPPLVDVVLALAVLAFAGTVWWGTADLPPPRYEPIGSAALPRALAAIMAVLGLVVLGRALRRPKQDAAPSDGAEPAFRPRPLLAIAVFAVLVLYVLVMDRGLLGFIPASIAAFLLIGGMLTGFAVRRLPWLTGFVIAIVVVIDLVFTRFFYIDLP